MELHTRKFGKVLVAILAALIVFPLLGSARQGEISNGREKISPLFANLLERVEPYGDGLPVIVRVRPDVFQENLHNALPLVRSYRARLNAFEIERLLEADQVEYVSVDHKLRLFGKGKSDSDGTGNAFNRALGAEQQFQGREMTNNLGVNGQNIVVAVFDSGLAGNGDIGGDRVVEIVDFTSGSPVLSGLSDPYGHGTHVAGIVAGSGAKSAGQYAGLATEAKLLVIRVVGPDGTGYTSNLIQAIDWVIANRDRYAVRVANLSLGHPALDSYRNDPLCQAVERMVAAGIVSVVSAGNLGKLDQQPEIWGGISSPGISPAVITVGAVNTQGTVSHSDIISTTYSSRGPTIDGIFKPDLVAPGNRIPSLRASNSHLGDQAELRIDRDYMYLSGSSMAAAYVSSTVAMMLEANPKLTPRMVKGLLIASAVKLVYPHMLEQGNGLLNVRTAVQLATALDLNTKTLSQDVEPFWDLDGETVWSGGAFALGDSIVYGPMTNPEIQPTWGSGVLWGESLISLDSMFWTEGLFDSGSFFWSDTYIRNDSLFWTEDVFWADSLFWTSDCLWADAVAASAFFWSDASIATDHTTVDTLAFLGDENLSETSVSPPDPLIFRPLPAPTKGPPGSATLIAPLRKQNR